MDYNITMANFNVTFGKEEKPLLTYFNSIVYNALQSDIKKVRYNKNTNITDTYYFMDVDICEDDEMGYVLYGKIVRETELEVKSVVENNNLIKKNEKYPTAPYSVFYIYLKNHRMILIKNQMGSPSAKTFGTVAKHVINKYVRQVNDQIRENNKKNEVKQKFYEYSRIEVVGLPREEDLKNALSNVKKINYLRLRFYPLNGDIDDEDIYMKVSRDFRTAVGSKTGNITLNSPDNKNGIIKLLDNANGVFDATIRVEYEDASTGTITSTSLSNSIKWNTDEDSINDYYFVKMKTSKIGKLRKVGQENNKIYMKYLNSIKELIKKKQ